MTSEQVQVSDIVRQKRNTTVHGVVVSLSPIKESAKNKEKKYFNAQIADNKKVVRMVSFDPKLWPNMEQSKEDHSSIALVNCDIQKAKKRGRADFSEYEVVAGMQTTIQKSPKKFKIEDDLLQSLASTVMHSITDISKISVGSVVSVMGKVTRVGDAEEVGSKQTLVKQDCYLSDASGTCRVVLWRKRINALAKGLSYRLKDVSIKQWDGMKYLSVVEDSSIESIDDIGAVADECELLEQRKMIVGEIASVLYCSNYLSCTECNAKVDTVDGVCGKCTKCYAVMKLAKCKRNVVCKVKIEEDDKSKEATIFANVLTKLIGPISTSVGDGDIERMLLAQPIKKYMINDNNVVLDACPISWRDDRGAVEKALGITRSPDPKLEA